MFFTWFNKFNHVKNINYQARTYILNFITFPFNIRFISCWMISYMNRRRLIHYFQILSPCVNLMSGVWVQWNVNGMSVKINNISDVHRIGFIFHCRPKHLLNEPSHSNTIDTPLVLETLAAWIYNITNEPSGAPTELNYELEIWFWSKMTTFHLLIGLYTELHESAWHFKGLQSKTVRVNLSSAKGR